MAQYLYLITDSTYYKIGIAKDVKKRIKQLQTGHPNILRIEAFYHVTLAKKKEKSLHIKYASKKRQGEWFALDSNDLYEIKKYLNSVCERQY